VSRITNATSGFGSVSFPFHAKVRGKYLYFSSLSDDTITVADISDPYNPVFVDSITGNGTTILMDSPTHFDIVGSYLYVTTITDNRLTIIDISDPKDLTYVGSITDATALVSPVFPRVIGSHVIVGSASTASTYNLAVIDVSDPTTPSVVNRVAADGSNLIKGVLDMQVQGNYLYTVSLGSGGINGGLQIYDIGSTKMETSEIGSATISKLFVEQESRFRDRAEFLSGVEIGSNGLVTYGNILFGSRVASTTSAMVTNTLQFSNTALFQSNVTSTDDVAFVFDTKHALATTSHVLSIRNTGTRLLDLSANGNIDINGSVTINMSSTTAPTTIGVCKSGADGSYENLELVECSSTPSDIAEFYEATADVEAGDIVMLTGDTVTYTEELYDPITGLPRHNTIVKEEGIITRGNQIKKESTISIVTKADKTKGRAFGIVSTNPYQVLGKSVIDVAEHPQPIAVMGRVPTKVSLENGYIYPGDFITVSSIPGVGMKAGSADPVVGIALEPYSGSAENKIMVAISDASQGMMGAIQDLEQQLSEVYTSLAMNNPATVTINYNANNNTIEYGGENLQLAGKSIFGVSTIVSEGAAWRISSDGLFVSTVVTDSGTKDLYTLQSEDQEIIISGSSALTDGSARISFDDIYKEIIDDTRAIKITVTLTSEANGVFVTDKSAAGFTVKELQSGISNATFDWVAIVYRKILPTGTIFVPETSSIETPTNGSEQMEQEEDEAIVPSTSTPEEIDITTSSPDIAATATEEVENAVEDDTPITSQPSSSENDPIEEEIEIENETDVLNEEVQDSPQPQPEAVVQSEESVNSEETP
jgi:hypothetical protein